MAKRGRKSASELAAQAHADALEIIERPAPPLDLTEAESDVWIMVVDSMPADWFKPETYPLLSQYCRHTVQARRVAQLIDAEMAREQLDVDALKTLDNMQAKNTAAMKAMAAAMRIAQQSSYSARGAAGKKATGTTRPRPWES